jgi:hypothetical protein
VSRRPVLAQLVENANVVVWKILVAFVVPKSTCGSSGKKCSHHPCFPDCPVPRASICCSAGLGGPVTVQMDTSSPPHLPVH